MWVKNSNGLLVIDKTKLDDTFTLNFRKKDFNKFQSDEIANLFGSDVIFIKENIPYNI